MLKRMNRICWDGPEVARLRYYLGNATARLLPAPVYRRQRRALEAALAQCEDEAVFARARYYHKWQQPFVLGDAARPFRLDLSKGRSAYQYDLYAGLRYFQTDLRIDARLGDIREVPATPAIVKSRPIAPANENAVLLNLNKVRHFYFVRDPYAFSEKADRLVWRGRACQQHRKDFLARYYGHPLCDVGHYHRRHQDVSWTKPELSVHEQLRYKYILAIEGNDVATSLKWILSSHSLCFMTKPRFETWFMEGRLVAGQHYVELRDDYADLEEKISYYNRHPDEAQAMIRAANEWVAQFQNPFRERLICLLVLWHYFYFSGQLALPPPGLAEVVAAGA